MPHPSEARARDTAHVTLALIHPMRAWVEALEGLLEPRSGIEVVAAHTSPGWVRNAVMTLRANVLLLHLETPVNGLGRMLEEMFDANPDLSVVALSDSRDPAVLSAAVRAGVRGWVEPTASIDHLVTVIQGVHRGECWFPPALMAPVIDGLLDAAETREQANDALSALSSRETEVLQCLAHGLTRQEIADRYVLSPHTVRTHINNVLRKLDVHSTLAAVSIARQVGLSESLPRQRDHES